MNQLTNKLDLILFGYNPQEFLPVRYDGKLINKRSYVLYRLGKLITRLVMAFDNLYQTVSS